MSPASSRLLPRFCTLLLIGVTVAGCASPPAKPAAETPGQPAPATDGRSHDRAASPANPDTSTPASDPGTSDPAALLAAQTEQYARAIEASLAARSAAAGTPSAAAGTPSPTGSPARSTSSFEVAEEFRLSPGVQAPTPQAARVDRPRPAPASPPAIVAANRAIEVPGEATPSPANPPPAPQPSVSAAPSPEPAVRVVTSLEQQLQQRVRDYPQDVSAHLDYQLLLFLRDEPVPNLSAMSSLPAEDRELITAFMDGISNFRNAVRADANMLMSRKVRPLVEMADRLRSRSDLGIPTLALCRKVEGFGRYEPIEPARFVAGKPHPVIIYCEVENFSSQLNDGKMWETRLSQDAVLYTENGLPVWSVKTESFSDLARNRRRDFFVVKLVTLPDNLVIGRYLLKVTIIDQQANRVAEASLPLQVVAR